MFVTEPHRKCLTHGSNLTREGGTSSGFDLTSFDANGLKRKTTNMCVLLQTHINFFLISLLRKFNAFILVQILNRDVDNLFLLC